MKTTTAALRLLTLTATTLFAGAAGAALIQESLKLTAADGSASDFFGWSVAIGDGVVVAGAYVDNPHGNGSGSAYLFDSENGSPLFKLDASDGTFGDQFGYAVGVSGNVAIIGAPGDTPHGGSSGSAYLFDILTGQQLFKLTASDGASGDQFGLSVAISGNRAIVGAPFDDDNGFSGSGSAYVFDVTTGQQIVKLTSADARTNDFTGFSVGISGDKAIVGSFGSNLRGDDSGSAYLFDAVSGVQIARLLASDGRTGDTFGWSVAISDGTAIVGAKDDDDDGNSSGSAYLFSAVDGTQLAKLTAADGGTGDRFGSSVGISGRVAVVGSANDAELGINSGSAYLFDVTDGTELAKLLASDGAANDSFGVSVGVHEGKVVVGAYRDDDRGDASGSAYLYSGVPEPSSWLLGLAGVLGLQGQRNRRSTI